ncbi:flavin reductase [Nocardioides sp.]|uniref:flavin reductase n=1 Tax=Nocardioides sp. TaxID=35761 RepID=UPI003D10CAD3
MGQFPTGVTVVTSTGEVGEPLGMAIGSFTSVSLDPPLVAFLPAKSSSSWPAMAAAGRFCVNVLGAKQEDLCRGFARSGGEKFDGVRYSSSPLGNPLLDGAVAWLDCAIETVHEAGDHLIVLGRVVDLAVSGNDLPLVFFRGGYGRFSPMSMAAVEPALLDIMRGVDLVRSEMETLASDLDTECIAVAPHGESLIFLASAGQGRRSRVPTRVGQRVPFIPPFGSVLVAGDDRAEADWLGRGAAVPDEQAALRRLLNAVRVRGYAVGEGYADYQVLERLLEGRGEVGRDALGGMVFVDAQRAADDEFEVRNMSCAIRGADGKPVMQLTIYGPATPCSPRELADLGGRLMKACAVASRALGHTLSSQVG